MRPPDPWSRPPPSPKSSGPLWKWWLAALVLLAGLLAGLAAAFPEVLEMEETRMGLFHRLAWLIVIGASLAMFVRHQPGLAIRHAAIWAGIFALLLIVYSLRHEAADLKNQILADLLPHRGIETTDAVTLTARRDGHFVVEAEVDGVPVRFLVDTGASDVVLSPGDARRVGFDLDKLAFVKPYRTANGMVMGAPVRLGRITVGPVSLTDVKASVNGAPMGTSLLGMSFLGRLSAYEVTGDRLTLRP